MGKKLILSIIVLAMLAVGCGKEATSDLNTQSKIDSNPQEVITQPADEPTPAQSETPQSENLPDSSDSLPVDKQEVKEAIIAALSPDDTSDDCNILSVEDIKNVCGIETVKEEQEVKPGTGVICSTIFKTSDPLKAIKLNYGGGYNPELAQEQLQHCLDGQKGEKVTDYACYADSAGKTVYIYGKKWKIYLSNSMPMEQYFICSADQLKELGTIISGRIY